VRDAVEEEGKSRQKPRERPGCSDVEENFLVTDGLLDPDDGAKRSKGYETRVEKRGGKKIGERRREPVAAAHEVVAHLVNAKDDEDRNREGQAVPQGPFSKNTSFF